MVFNIDTIKKDTSIKGVFFFDTMIWLKIIAPTFEEKSNDLKYINFFDKVYDGESSKIAVSSLLISEIINLYLKRVALKLYEEAEKTTVHYNEYKTKYRSTQHFKNQYQIVCDEIETRSDSFVYCQDILSDYLVTDASTNPNLDFNDYNYYQICKKEKYTLVTDDFDFYLRDIEILTLNNKLYKKQFEDLQLAKAKKP